MMIPDNTNNEIFCGIIIGLCVTALGIIIAALVLAAKRDVDAIIAELALRDKLKRELLDWNVEKMNRERKEHELQDSP
jgi:hypothetical protein